MLYTFVSGGFPTVQGFLLLHTSCLPRGHQSLVCRNMGGAEWRFRSFCTAVPEVILDVLPDGRVRIRPGERGKSAPAIIAMPEC